MPQGGALNKLGNNSEINKSVNEQNDEYYNDLGKLPESEIITAFASKINKPIRIGRGSDIEKSGVPPIKVNTPILAKNDVINEGIIPSGQNSNIIGMEKVIDSHGNMNAEGLIVVN